MSRQSAHNRVAVMHGVNLDTLGRRDPAIYGTQSLNELQVTIKRFAQDLDLEASFFQSNHEGELVEYMHRLSEIADSAIVNAGAWTHYSWALRDALEVAGLPAVEVHLSDVAKREDWRRLSVFDGVVVDVVSGEGPDGYKRALEILRRELGL